MRREREPGAADLTVVPPRLHLPNLPPSPCRFLHPGLSHFATGGEFRHHVFATQPMQNRWAALAALQTGAMATDVGPRDWRPECDGRGSPAGFGGSCGPAGSFVREGDTMRREKSLALLITLVAALAAAETLPGKKSRPGAALLPVLLLLQKRWPVLVADRCAVSGPVPTPCPSLGRYVRSLQRRLVLTCPTRKDRPAATRFSPPPFPAPLSGVPSPGGGCTGRRRESQPSPLPLPSPPPRLSQPRLAAGSGR